MCIFTLENFLIWAMWLFLREISELNELQWKGENTKKHKSYTHSSYKEKETSK